MAAPANPNPEYTRRLNELAATVLDLFENRPQYVETLVLINKEFLRFERLRFAPYFRKYFKHSRALSN